MTAAISFGRDRFNAPAFDVHDEAYSPIGSLLTSDVQTTDAWCLDLLAWVEDVRAGRSIEETWQGNSWSVRIVPTGVHLDDLYSEDWRGYYSLDVAHQIMLDYWAFLTGGRPGRASASIADWESESGRAHPCRPHL